MPPRIDKSKIIIGVNKAILLGNAASKVKIKDTKVGGKFAYFSLITTEYIHQTKRIIEWHHVVAFDLVASYAAREIQKGDIVYVEGCIRTRKWETPKGEKKVSFQIRANRLTNARPISTSDLPPETESPLDELDVDALEDTYENEVPKPEEEFPF